MTEREAYIAFNLVQDVGFVKVSALAAAAGGSVAEAYGAFPADRKIAFDGSPVDWEREIAKAAKSKVSLVTPADPAYPQALRDLASPPLCLAVAGSVEALSRPGVAIVGTRRATGYGRDAAERFAYALAAAGWSIVSGLAAGIDAAAHRGALAANGCTVGVLGGALDRFFPEENRALGREIVAAGGAVVSEYPFGRRPDVSTFPQRNRIVAALSHGVIAAECPQKSGTQITVSMAADLGRTVMAVPGRIDQPMSSGCLRLIREGAILVRSPDDAIEDLGSPESARRPAPAPAAARRRAAPAPAPRPAKAPAPAAPPPPAPPPARTPPAPASAVSIEEASVLRVLGDTPVTVDRIVRESGLSAARANSVLVGLRIKRKVRFMPGGRVSLFR